MEAIQEARLLALFDFYWFDYTVLKQNTTLPQPGDVVGALKPPLLPCEPTQRPFLSSEIAIATSSDSALLDHRARKLSPVLSGKPTSRKDDEATAEEEVGGSAGRRSGVGEERGRRCGRSRRGRGAGRWGGRSKSLSELELEELKGFMDLGFTFSGAEADKRLLSIVPGLQRLGRRRAPDQEEAGLVAEEAEGSAGEPGIPRRPYLSEAWEVVGLDERSERGHAYDHLLRNWRLPADGEGVDMKGHLRCWAHAVASAVR